ncbi:MAG: hypothetical protein M3Q65_22820 [Chloroflexota bacterium]|nr:hypothetical protein [Chloroflexota bacterium]
MAHIATVVFDGQVLRPETPLDLRANTRYRVTITPVVPEDTDAGDAWDVLDALSASVEAPADWASQHDHYLYGTPKQPQQRER